VVSVLMSDQDEVRIGYLGVIGIPVDRVDMDNLITELKIECPVSEKKDF
jgi:hypothetical protein